jgi:hypothetical protein
MTDTVAVIVGGYGPVAPGSPLLWRPKTLYRVNEQVVYERDLYVCIKEHTSGETFVEAGNWSPVATGAALAAEITRAEAAEGTIAANLTTEATTRAAAVTAAITTAENASDPAGSAATGETKAIAAATAKASAAQAGAEGASVPRTAVGADSGVMGLTAGGIGAQPPAHHASTHAEAGTDPLTTADLPASVVTSSAGATNIPFTSIGLVNAAAEPYGAKMDGVTDDTAARLRLHEAINAGTIRGYYVTGPMLLSSVGLTLTKTAEIRFFNGGKLVCSENASFSTAQGVIQFEAAYNEAHKLTANAEVGAYTLSVATAYADGAILKIGDPTTIWDPAGTSSRPAELLEVGVPDGFMASAAILEPGALSGTAAIGATLLPLVGAAAKGWAVNQRVLITSLTASVTGLSTFVEYWIVGSTEEGIELSASKGGAAIKVAGHALEAATMLVVSTKLTAGQTVYGLILTNENPVVNLEKAEKREAGGYTWPATGELALGSDSLPYNASTWNNPYGSGNFIAFTLTAGHVLVGSYNQGYRAKLIAEAGTVYLRTPVSHEYGYTTANECIVGSMNPIVGARVENAQVDGTLFGEGVIGIRIVGGINCNVNQPRIENCLNMALSFIDCWDSHILNSWVENSRELNFTSGGRAYGHSFAGATQDCSITGGRTRRTRHSYTQGGSGPVSALKEMGLPRRNKVINHTSVATFADAFDSHGGAIDITLINCTARQPNGACFNINCAQMKILGCTAEHPQGSYFQAANQSIGVTDVLADITGVGTAKAGFTVGAAVATGVGETVRRIRLTGAIDSPTATAVSVTGSQTHWKMKNVSVDVAVRKGPSASGYQAVSVSDAENVSVKLQAEGLFKNNHQVELTRVTGYTVTGEGEWTWAEAGGTGDGVLAVECTDGRIIEPAMVNLGGKSTKLENSTTHTLVFGGPNESIELGTGTGNETRGKAGGVEVGELGEVGEVKLAEEHANPAGAAPVMMHVILEGEAGTAISYQIKVNGKTLWAAEAKPAPLLSGFTPYEVYAFLVPASGKYEVTGTHVKKAYVKYQTL